MHLAIRVFINGIRQSEERLTMSPDDLDELLPRLAEKHAALMAESPGMVEIEFLDELNPEARYFRIGTDPGGMVNPMAVALDNPLAALDKWFERNPEN